MLLGLAVLAQRWHIGPRSGQTVLSQIMADGRRPALGLLRRVAHHHHRPGPGRQHLLRRPARPRQPAGPGQLPAPPLLAAGRPAGLRQRHLGAGRPLGRAAGRRRRQHQRPDPAVRHRGLHRLHALPDRPGVHWRRTRPPGWAAPGRRSTASAPCSPQSPPSSSSSPSSPKGPGWSSSPSRPSSSLFRRIHALLRASAATNSASARRPTPPTPKRTLVVVPVTRVSRLTRARPLRGALAGHEVMAVTVVFEGERRVAAVDAGRLLQRQWERGTPGCPFGCCTPSTPRWSNPSSAFIDDLRDESPTTRSSCSSRSSAPASRYRILHNQIDLVLSAALRSRTDVVVARVALPMHLAGHHDDPPEESRRPASVSSHPRPCREEGGHDGLSDPSTPGRALLDERGRALLGVLAAEHLRLPLASPTRAPSPDRSTPYARAPWWPATPAARCGRCARPTRRRRRAPRPPAPPC